MYTIHNPPELTWICPIVWGGYGTVRLEYQKWHASLDSFENNVFAKMGEKKVSHSFQTASRSGKSSPILPLEIEFSSSIVVPPSLPHCRIESLISIGGGKDPLPSLFLLFKVIPLPGYFPWHVLWYEITNDFSILFAVLQTKNETLLNLLNPGY